jgi:predicted  nucleic acid-binding Zn-ribbon protein
MLAISTMETDMSADERLVKFESDMTQVRSDIVEIKGKLQELWDSLHSLRVEFGEFKTEVTAQFGQIRAEMAKQIGDFKTEVAAQFGQIRAEMVKQAGEFKTEMARQAGDNKAEFLRVRLWMLGMWLTTLVGIVGAVISGRMH